MESAERNGSALRRRLFSADLFNEAAMRLGSRNVNTPVSRVKASLCSVTRRDHRRPARPSAVAGRDARDFRARLAGLRGLRRPEDAVVFRAITPPRWKWTFNEILTRGFTTRSAARLAPSRPRVK